MHTTNSLKLLLTDLYQIQTEVPITTYKRPIFTNAYLIIIVNDAYLFEDLKNVHRIKTFRNLINEHTLK